MAEHLVLRSPLHRSSTAYILQSVSPTIDMMPISYLSQDHIIEWSDMIDRFVVAMHMVSLSMS
jgi:hypothetical protein